MGILEDLAEVRSRYNTTVNNIEGISSSNRVNELANMLYEGGAVPSESVSSEDPLSDALTSLANRPQKKIKFGIGNIVDEAVEKFNTAFAPIPVEDRPSFDDNVDIEQARIDGNVAATKAILMLGSGAASFMADVIGESAGAVAGKALETPSIAAAAIAGLSGRPEAAEKFLEEKVDTRQFMSDIEHASSFLAYQPKPGDETGEVAQKMVDPALSVLEDIERPFNVAEEFYADKDLPVLGRVLNRGGLLTAFKVAHGAGKVLSNRAKGWARRTQSKIKKTESDLEAEKAGEAALAELEKDPLLKGDIEDFEILLADQIKHADTAAVNTLKLSYKILPGKGRQKGSIEAFLKSEGVDLGDSLLVRSTPMEKPVKKSEALAKDLEAKGSVEEAAKVRDNIDADTMKGGGIQAALENERAREVKKVEDTTVSSKDATISLLKDIEKSKKTKPKTPEEILESKARDTKEGELNPEQAIEDIRKLKKPETEAEFDTFREQVNDIAKNYDSTDARYFGLDEFITNAFDALRVDLGLKESFDPVTIAKPKSVSHTPLPKSKKTGVDLIKERQEELVRKRELEELLKEDPEAALREEGELRPEDLEFEVDPDILPQVAEPKAQARVYENPNKPGEYVLSGADRRVIKRYKVRKAAENARDKLNEKSSLAETTETLKGERGEIDLELVRDMIEATKRAGIRFEDFVESLKLSPEQTAEYFRQAKKLQKSGLKLEPAFPESYETGRIVNEKDRNGDNRVKKLRDGDVYRRQACV